MTRNREAGQALALTAAALVVIMGFMGLGIDLGALRYEKRLQQTAADGAAIAGAEELRNGGNLSGITSAAKDGAKANGFSDTGTYCSTGCPSSGSAGYVTVTVNSPPASGPHASDDGCSPSPSCYVEVLISEVHATYFLPVVGTFLRTQSLNQATVTARAVATLRSELGGTGGCIYTLGPQGTGVGVTNSGTPTVTAPTCSVFDNGNWTTHGQPVDFTAGSIGVVGTAVNNGGGTVTPTPVTGIAPVTDPLSYLQTPAVGTPVNWAGNPVPGTTYSSITVNGGTTVNFPAGTYIVDGGQFHIDGGATICNQTGTGCSATGTPNAGVMFYITGGATVYVNGNANAYLAAPNSGAYAGILFYQDHMDCQAATLNGTATSYYQGGLYFHGDPAAGCNVQLNFGGNLTNTTAAYTVIVTDDLKFFGTSNVTIKSNYSLLPGGVFPIKNAYLVE